MDSGLLAACRRSLTQISVTLKGVTGDLDPAQDTVEVHAAQDLPELQQLAQLVKERVKRVLTELDNARRQAMCGTPGRRG